MGGDNKNNPRSSHRRQYGQQKKGTATKNDSPEMKEAPKKYSSSVYRLTSRQIPVHFPYQPYPTQLMVMSKLIDTLCDASESGQSRNAVIESPTGTGKSLTMLCGILGWLEYEKKRVKCQERSGETPKSSASKLPTDEPSASKLPTDGPSASKLPTDGPSISRLPTDGPSISRLPTDGPSVSKLPTGPSVSKLPCGSNLQAPTQFSAKTPQFLKSSFSISNSQNNKNNNNQKQPVVISLLNSSDSDSDSFTQDLMLLSPQNTISNSRNNNHFCCPSDNNSCPNLNNSDVDQNVFDLLNEYDNESQMLQQPNGSARQFSDPQILLNTQSQLRNGDDDALNPHQSLPSSHQSPSSSCQSQGELTKRKGLSFSEKLDRQFLHGLKPIGAQTRPSPNLNVLNSEFAPRPSKQIKSDFFDEMDLVFNFQDCTGASFEKAQELMSVADWDFSRAVLLWEESPNRYHWQSKPNVAPLPKSPGPPRIFFASRTHTQITQLISELRKTRYKPHVCVLGSRDQGLCINPALSGSKNKNEDCADILKKKQCTRWDNVGRVKVPPVYDIEDIITAGKNVQGCPYFATRARYKVAEIVFCPYSYLINPFIREMIDPQISDAIIIFDEAHNIDDICREEMSCTLDMQEIKDVRNEIARWSIYNRTVINAATSIIDTLQAIENRLRLACPEVLDTEWKTNEIMQFLKDTKLDLFWKSTQDKAFALLSQNSINAQQDAQNEAIKPSQKAKTVNKGKEKKKVLTFSLATTTMLEKLFLQLIPLLAQGHQSSYAVVFETTIVFENKDEKRKKYTADFFCLSPALAFSQLQKISRSIILTSGTLSPFEWLEAELQCKFQHSLSAPHIVDIDNQLSVSVLRCVGNSIMDASFKNVNNTDYQDNVLRGLVGIVQRVPFGALVFVPSYRILASLQERWTQQKSLQELRKHKAIFWESDRHENLLRRFTESATNKEGKGAILFAVFRGRVSEGLDFKDDICRVVICLGIPFPPFKDTRVMLKQKWNDQQKTRNPNVICGQEWYVLKAMRALNQAIGRGLRHIRDFTSIIFMDVRFTKQDILKGLSGWIRREIVGRESKVYNDWKPLSQSLARFFTRFYTPDLQPIEWWEPYRREKFLLLLCARKWIASSLFHEDFMPRDIFKVICVLSRLL